MLRAAIFDVDGTLVDSVDLHAKCWQEAFARFGFQLPFQKIRSQIGKGGDQLLPYFLKPQELEEHGEALDGLRSELFREEYLEQVKPFPKVRELFERIRADGRRIALASSGKAEEIEHYVKLCNIDDVVDIRTTSDDSEKSKPHPDIFQAAMDKLGIEAPREAVVIGDSPFDAEAAGRVSIPTIAVLCGGFSTDDLKKAGARWFFKHPAELLARYDESPLWARLNQVESAAPSSP